MKEITDKDRIDFLQKLNDRKVYTGKCVLRESATGRGWRLHETSDAHFQASENVRDAIDHKIIEYKEYGDIK